VLVNFNTSQERVIARRKELLALLQKEPRTQGELVQALKDAGHAGITQPVVSRDLTFIGAAKRRGKWFIDAESITS
jgi:arginine repressor